MTDIKNVHDGFFKENARMFFQHFLPRPVLQLMDMDSLGRIGNSKHIFVQPPMAAGFAGPCFLMMEIQAGDKTGIQHPKNRQKHDS